MYIARIKIDYGKNNKNIFYEVNKWHKLFKYEGKECRWRIKESGIIEFVLGNYENRFDALEDGKMLYFNILYDLHRNEFGFRLGDSNYVTRMYHDGRGYTLDEFIKNEEWFFNSKTDTSNFLGLGVYEIDDNINDYDRYHNCYNVEIHAENNEPFKFLGRIINLDRNYKYSLQSQEIFNLISLSEKADEKTKILLLCQALETMGRNEKKSKDEINIIEQCTKIVMESNLKENEKNSLLGMFEGSKYISSRSKCKKVVEKYCKNEYKQFEKKKVINEAYSLRSDIIHGNKLGEDTDFSCSYYLKIIVLDTLKEWSKEQNKALEEKVKMDLKASFMLEHYRQLIENREFDEFDILGFLIFIRNYIKISKNFVLIEEFADLVAHRERDRGKVMTCISKAIDNNYAYDVCAKKIQGYDGIYEEDWKKEWIDLGRKYQILIDDDVVKEITLCIFSLAQKTSYKDKKGHNGVIEFDAISRTGEIALLTTEGKNDSLFICFSKYGGYTIDAKYDEKQINDVVCTYREDGKLKLKSNLDIIIEV